MTKSLLLFALCAASAAAQSSPVMDSVRLQYNNAKRNLIEAAQFMPAEHYGFKLTPAQRAYGEWVEHTAGMNLRACAAAQGVPAPAAPKPTGVRDSAVQAIEASFAFCDTALAAVTDTHILRTVNENPRRTALDGILGYIASLNSHYGNMVGYLRAKGITPPTTARSQQQAAPHKH